MSRFATAILSGETELALGTIRVNLFRAHIEISILVIIENVKMLD